MKEPLCDFLGVQYPDRIPYPHKKREDDFERILLAAKSYVENLRPTTCDGEGLSVSTVSGLPQVSSPGISMEPAVTDR